MANAHQLTGNAGLYYICWQLSRRGWHAMPTVRNARGSDLMITDSAESVFLGIQSKALSKRNPVPLGTSLETLRSDWWIITIHANGPHPQCFILTLGEVKATAKRGEKDGRISYWLQPTAYDRDDYRDAWQRLGTPISA
jgi:hypothetical protein